MKEILDILSTIKDFSPIAVIGLLAVIIFLLVKETGFLNLKGGKTEGRFDALDKQISLLGSNHLHEVNDTLKRIEDKMERMNDGITYIKARVNGRS